MISVTVWELGGERQNFPLYMGFSKPLLQIFTLIDRIEFSQKKVVFYICGVCSSRFWLTATHLLPSYNVMCTVPPPPPRKKMFSLRLADAQEEGDERFL